MFERFTEKARRVIFFARYEGSQFGSPEIRTEHLLLGLLRESAATVSRHAGRDLDREQLRTAIAKFAWAGEKIATSVDLPLSNESKRILAYAAEEADSLGHKHIGTEHLLLGILREESCSAAQLLHQQGFELDRARKSIAADVSSGSGVGSGVVGGTASELSARFAGGIGLVEISPTEFLVTQPRGANIPRAGEKITIQESGVPERRYQVEDVAWQFERSEGVSHLKTVKIKVSRIDATESEPGPEQA
jgi:hypothetical protein